MTSTLEHETDRAARRAAMVRLIAHYPDIAEDELHTLLHYFRRDASAIDRALIARRTDVRRPYRQLCADHQIGRLGRIESGVTIAFGVLLILAGLLHGLGVWSW